MHTLFHSWRPRQDKSRSHRRSSFNLKEFSTLLRSTSSTFFQCQIAYPTTQVSNGTPLTGRPTTTTRRLSTRRSMEVGNQPYQLTGRRSPPHGAPPPLPAETDYTGDARRTARYPTDSHTQNQANRHATEERRAESGQIPLAARSLAPTTTSALPFAAKQRPKSSRSRTNNHGDSITLAIHILTSNGIR
jgi:hypothetical protein